MSAGEDKRVPPLEDADLADENTVVMSTPFTPVPGPAKLTPAPVQQVGSSGYRPATRKRTHIGLGDAKSLPSSRPPPPRYSYDDDAPTRVMPPPDAGSYSFARDDEGRLKPSSRPPSKGSNPPPSSHTNQVTRVDAAPVHTIEEVALPTQPHLPKFDAPADELPTHPAASPGPLEVQPVVSAEAEPPRAPQASSSDIKGIDPTRAFPHLPSAAPFQPNSQPGSVRARVRLDKWRYRGAIFGSSVLAIGAGVGSSFVPSATLASVLLGVAGALVLVSVVSHLVLAYRMWSAIQDGYAKTTPLLAALLLLVPLLNLYWVFNVFPGFAADYNRYVQRHHLDAKPISVNLVSAAMVVPVAGFFLWWVVLGQICDGVTSLSYRPAPPVSAPTH